MKKPTDFKSIVPAKFQRPGKLKQHEVLELGQEGIAARCSWLRQLKNQRNTAKKIAKIDP